MPPRRPAGTPTPPAVKASDAYHHGDLRSALIAAAREALETSPPEAITLKSLALRLGVSQPAPYRHFDSREALLAAVATDGFRRFLDAMSEAAANAPDTEKFELGCLAYIGFGRANRGVYRLMFASNLLSTAKDGVLIDASAAAFGFLQGGLARLVPSGAVEATAMWVWATLHGLVMLDAEGLTDNATTGHLPLAEIVHQMIRTLTRQAG